MIDIRKATGEFSHFGFGPFFIVYAMSSKIPACFTIGRNVSQTEYQLLAESFQLITYSFYFAEQVLDANFVRKNQRIESPYDAAESKDIHKSFECFNPLSQRRHPRFQTFLLIIVERILDLAIYPMKLCRNLESAWI